MRSSAAVLDIPEKCRILVLIVLDGDCGQRPSDQGTCPRTLYVLPAPVAHVFCHTRCERYFKFISTNSSRSRLLSFTLTTCPSYLLSAALLHIAQLLTVISLTSIQRFRGSVYHGVS